MLHKFASTKYLRSKFFEFYIIIIITSNHLTLKIHLKTHAVMRSAGDVFSIRACFFIINLQLLGTGQGVGSPRRIKSCLQLHKPSLHILLRNLLEGVEEGGLISVYKVIPLIS